MEVAPTREYPTIPRCYVGVSTFFDNIGADGEREHRGVCQGSSGSQPPASREWRPLIHSSILLIVWAACRCRDRAGISARARCRPWRPEGGESLIWRAVGANVNQPYKVNVLIDSECRARLADFGLTMVIEESTAGSTTNHYEMGGTVRWMAPEVMHPEKFGFTGRYRKRLPSRSTDIYALGMTIFEVSAFTSQIPPLGCHTTFWVGHYGMSSVQRRPHGAGCHMQSHRRRPTGEAIFRVFGSVVEVVSERLACGAWTPTFPTPVGLHHTQSTERRR